MRHDIWKFGLILCAAGVIGFLAGHALLAMLFAAIAIIAWQMFHLNLLYLWSINAQKNPMPETSGQTYLLHRELNRRRIQNQNRKRQLSLLLNQFRQAISVLPDAIVLIDNQGKIEWANSNAKTVLGIKWPADSQVRFSDLIRYPEVDQILQSKKPKIEGVIVNSLLNNGQTINIKCVRYTDNLRMIIARDVSQLIKVNQMHSDFVANVSHELKTPLTVLRGYLEIMEDSSQLPDTFVKPLNQMSLQSIRMQLIVGDLLYLAKLEDSISIKNHEPVDVTQVVNTIVETIQPLIAEKNHKIELDIDYSIKLIGAQTELHSAFSNLIANAINYTPNTGLVKVRWRKSGDYVEFSVRDNGLGIAPQHIDRLTQRFYRIDTDRSRDSGGTGLGLAIVKHVLQRHNAELEVTSKEGSGSEFKCIFPLTQTSADSIKNTDEVVIN